jgi:hypothetical protein
MIKFLGSILVILLIIALAGLSVAGLVPGLSSLVGASPKNFGITVTQADSISAQNKVGTEIISAPKGTTDDNGFKLEGKKDAEFSMDSKELTALNNNRAWKNYPLKNVQTRINADGSVESSGVIVVKKGIPYAMGLGYSETDIKNAMNKYNLPTVEVPFYLKGVGSVTNDKVKIDVSAIKIGAISVPQGIANSVASEAEKILDDVIRKNSQSFHCESLTFTDGKMNFKGQVAEKQYVISN